MKKSLAKALSAQRILKNITAKARRTQRILYKLGVLGVFAVKFSRYLCALGGFARDFLASFASDSFTL